MIILGIQINNRYEIKQTIFIIMIIMAITVNMKR